MNNNITQMIGKKVKRGDRYGVISSFNPSHKACIVVTWDDGRKEGWFDMKGTDGTNDTSSHIEILQQ